MSAARPHINVCLLQPAGYIHAFALLEAAEFVVAKAQAAGYPAALCKNRLRPDGLNIVFGAHINPKGWNTFPPNTVLFNTEQLPATSHWTSPEYRALLHRHIVWDYSPTNLANLGHDRAHLVSFYHAPVLDRIRRAPAPEYDLVFYGWVNERRKAQLDRLQAAGLKLLPVFNLYGAERDAALANARAVLNLHFYDAQIFQQIRAFYPLANGIPVISENFPPGTAPALYDEVVFASGNEALETYAARLLHDRDAFAREAARRTTLFRATVDNPEFAQVLQHTLAALAATPAAPASPTRINLGSGKDYRPGELNIDIDPALNPDLLLDLSATLDLPLTLDSPVYGRVVLAADSIEEISAIDVLEHVPNLTRLMTNCLTLLREGGRFVIVVPYELGLGAWQDPTHVRAFNENSWLYYTEWFWYLGWFEHRFNCDLIDIIPSELGRKMIDARVAQEELLRTPRAIDSMKVVLSKRRTTPEEKTSARAFRNTL